MAETSLAERMEAQNNLIQFTDDEADEETANADDSAFFTGELTHQLPDKNVLYSTSEENEDADDKVENPDWITMQNGEHVPLVGGVAAGGPMKGRVFSSATSQKKSAASHTARNISALKKSLASVKDSYDREREYEKCLDNAPVGDNFCIVYSDGKTVEYKKEKSGWKSVESFEDGRPDRVSDAKSYQIAESIDERYNRFAETKVDAEKALKAIRSENLGSSKKASQESIDSLNSAAEKLSASEYRTGDSNEKRSAVKSEVKAEVESVLDEAENGTVLYVSNESRNGPGWFSYAIMKDDKGDWSYVNPKTGAKEDKIGTAADVAEQYVEYNRNLGFSTDYEACQTYKKTLDKRMHDLDNSPVDTSDIGASRDVHAAQAGKITDTSEDFGKPGRYVMYRQGSLGNNSMMFFAPQKEGADLYAFAHKNENGGNTVQYEVDIKNPLVVRGNGDVDCINQAYAALHPDNPKKIMTASQWKKADGANASALKKSGYDAIIYVINGKASEIQVPKARTKDLERTGSFSTTGWSRMGYTFEQAKRKGLYDRDPHDYVRIDSREDSYDDDDFTIDDLYYFIREKELEKAAQKDSDDNTIYQTGEDGVTYIIKDGEVIGIADTERGVEYYREEDYHGKDGMIAAGKRNRLDPNEFAGEFTAQKVTQKVKACGTYLSYLGYNKTPQKVYSDDFNAIRTSFPILYIGFTNYDYLNDFVSGVRFLGRSKNGLGTTLTTNPGDANEFANGTGYVCQLKLRSNAKVINAEDLFRVINDRYADPIDDDMLEAIYYEPSTVAASLGYDVIYDSADQWYNVINRGSLIVNIGDRPSDDDDFNKDSNFDADEPDWITTKNGSHIPLNEEGTAIGGPLKGKTFSKASSSISDKTVLDKINDLEERDPFGTVSTPIKTIGLSTGRKAQEKWKKVPVKERKKLPIEEVNIDDVYTWQRIVNKKGLKKLAEKADVESSSDYPMAVRMNGDIILMDGNHRIAYDLLSGKEKVKIRVKNFDSSDNTENQDGGPGSGNFGHKGVKGQVGGSAPSDGTDSDFGREKISCGGKLTSEKIKDVLEKIDDGEFSSEGSFVFSKEFTKDEKETYESAGFNSHPFEYSDDELIDMFTGEIVASGHDNIAKFLSGAKFESRDYEAEYENLPVKDASHSMLRNMNDYVDDDFKDANEKGRHYRPVDDPYEWNGDSVIPSKKLVEKTASMTGSTEKEAEQMCIATGNWLGSHEHGYSAIRAASNGNNSNAEDVRNAENLEALIEKSQKFQGGPLFRGITASYEDAMKIIESIENKSVYSQGGITSWTDVEDCADNFASERTTDDKPVPIIFVNQSKQHNGTSITHMSNDGLPEVLCSKKTRYINTGYANDGGCLYIYTREVDEDGKYV